MIRRFLGIFQPQIVPRKASRIPRCLTVPSLAVRTCSITAHCAPVMFHTLKTTIAVWPSGLSRRRPSLLSSSFSPKNRRFIYLFIYPAQKASCHARKPPLAPLTDPVYPRPGWTKDRSSLPVQQLQLFAVEIVWKRKRRQREYSIDRACKKRLANFLKLSSFLNNLLLELKS